MEIDKESSLDSESPWGPRVPVTIDPDQGLITAGEASRPIDVQGDVSMALSSYLSMVYELRSMTTGVIPLRQEDLLVLANAFEMDETDIAEKLARLMHCDDLQTRRFVQMVKKGRVLVPVSMVAAGALLAVSLTFNSPAVSTPSQTQSKTHAPVELATTTTTLPAVISVDIGQAAQVEKAIVTDEVSEESNDESKQADQVEVAPESDVDFPGPGEVIVGEGISLSRD